MNISIFQKGGEKKYLPVLENAAQYYADVLMSKRMSNTLNLRIEMRATKLKTKVYGDCSTEPTGSKSSKDFVIQIQRDLPIQDQLETLAHEMVHVYQKAYNILQLRRWKSDGKYHVRWNGKELGVLGSVPYLEQPWEKEALLLEKTMRAAFINRRKNNSERENYFKEKIQDKMKHLMFERASFLEMTS